jgi:uncharacterized protein YkwD
MKPRLILACTGLLVLQPLVSQSVLASETYAEFVVRMNNVAVEGYHFRPDLENTVLRLANQYRASRGAGALKPNSKLLRAARAHALDMAMHDFVGHVSSNGRDFDSRMHAIMPGQLFLPSMGENAARASDGVAQSLMTQWIKSPPHRRVLSSRSYVSVATAVVQKGTKLYSVEIFSGPEVKTNMGQSPQPGGLSGGLY